jgi:hypothetical protein
MERAGLTLATRWWRQERKWCVILFPCKRLLRMVKRTGTNVWFDLLIYIWQDASWPSVSTHRQLLSPKPCFNVHSRRYYVCSQK